jgi:hypothetical protein
LLLIADRESAMARLGNCSWGEAMRRLCALIVLLFLTTGCASDGQKHWYDEALKDARGDNMEMRGFKSATVTSD